jgi:tRNA-splicing ligase RtcB
MIEKNLLTPVKDQPNFYTAEAGDGKFLQVVANEKIAGAMEKAAVNQACCALHSHGVESALLTPDAHVGYGTAVGSVIQTNGSIFPYFVGVDIACGMRLVKTELGADAVADKSERLKLVQEIHRQIPVGMDCHATRVLDEGDTRQILSGKLLYDTAGNIERSDLQTDLFPEGGAVNKAQYQFGTLGGGNHFVELQKVTEVDGKLSEQWGLKLGQLVIMIHSGSRKVGFDICNRYHGELRRWFDKQNIKLDNPWATFGFTRHSPSSDEFTEEQEKFLRKYGEAYIQEMYHANNFAVTNRHFMQEAVQRAFKKRRLKPRAELLYDISHNIAAIEDDRIIIRKGATRAMPKGHPMLKGTEWYETGHPIILPGSMDSSSYIMVGTRDAVRTHYSINHGAGRTMSRVEAKRTVDRAAAKKRMRDISMNHTVTDLIDETRAAYKDISEITDSVVGAGIARVVAKVEPLGVVKGKKEERRKKKRLSL